MRNAIREIFPRFTDRFEGTVPTLYTDVLNLVTVGRGNLVDPVELALPLPFQRIADGGQASGDEIRGEWTRVKRGGFARLGWRAAAKAATLALSPEAVDALTLAKLDANEAILAGRWDVWDSLPASAQLAVHSIAWACGPAFRFPRLEAALCVADWEACATESHLDETGNPGLVPRNAAQRALFLACGTTDPDVVAWP